MNKNSLHLASSIVFYITLSVSSQAQSIIAGTWGIDAEGFVANRSGTSGSNSPFLFGNSEDSGGQGAAFDSATATDARGIFSSEASLLGDLSAFASVSTRAETFQNASAQGRAFAIDSFIYNGVAEAEFSIDVNLSGTLTNSTNDPSDFAGNFADVYVLLDTELLNFDLIRFGQGEVWFPVEQINLEQTDVNSQLSGLLEFTVQPGQTFSLYAVGESRMYGESGVADASNTLTLGYSSGPLNDLNRIGTPVPEPASFGLWLGLGIASLLVRRRGHR